MGIPACTFKQLWDSVDCRAPAWAHAGEAPRALVVHLTERVLLTSVPGGSSPSGLLSALLLSSRIALTTLRCWPEKVAGLGSSWLLALGTTCLSSFTKFIASGASFGTCCSSIRWRYPGPADVRGLGGGRCTGWGTGYIEEGACWGGDKKWDWFSREGQATPGKEEEGIQGAPMWGQPWMDGTLWNSEMWIVEDHRVVREAPVHLSARDETEIELHRLFV